MASLDLTGQASEDEPARTTQLPDNNNLSTTRGSNRGGSNGGGGGILSFLPSPIDLWRERTPLSLVLLPLVFVVFMILQLPLHYNSTAENSATLHDISDEQWTGRTRQVDTMSNELPKIEKHLDDVKEDQDDMRLVVKDLRRRLGRIHDRRIARERELAERLERERTKAEQERTGLNGGPIVHVSVSTAARVVTFAGGRAVVESESKKGD